MTRPSEIPLSPRDYLIMLVLAREPAHGYGIIKRAETLSGDPIPLDPANLYRALRRLDRDGLVRVEEAPQDEGSGGRRTYALTERGRDVVEAEAARLARLTDTARAWRLIPDAGRRA
ncbi:MAG: PadR family transcriptional regulator [Gemmatimonadota bacterium]|nr:PadR family transcriptional regulator [Gemmatimonadota bacterium]